VPRKSAAVFVVTALALLALVLIPATFAAKGGQAGGKPGGGSGGGNSVSLHLLNGDTQPLFSHQVTFDVTASFSQPWVNLNCYKDGAWVSGEWGGFFAGSAYDQIFSLGPSNSWASGDADCTASLVEWTAKGSLVTRATTPSFHVYG
jgi:hypothetical protein